MTAATDGSAAMISACQNSTGSFLHELVIRNRLCFANAAQSPSPLHLRPHYLLPRIFEDWRQDAIDHNYGGNGTGAVYRHSGPFEDHSVRNLAHARNLGSLSPLAKEEQRMSAYRVRLLGEREDSERVSLD